MRYTPDQYIVWSNGNFHLTATVFFTWIVMLVLILSAIILRKKINTHKNISGIQNFFEVIVGTIDTEVKEMGGAQSKYVFSFIGTLFLFILASNLIGLIPYFMSPTSSLSTTAALASCVFLSVPFFGIKKNGIFGYMKHYFTPSPLLMPLNVISEFSGSLALAIRLYGNIMSGAIIGMVLLLVIPFIFPVFIQLLGFVSGIIQAYIFSMLALVFIVSAEPED